MFSKGVEIKDPDTGTVIGNTRRKIAELKLIQIDKLVSKLSRSDEMENELEIGNEILGNAKSIAVLPFFNSRGFETADSRRISEEILTPFVDSELKVVERRLLDKVAGEIGLQQGIAFDDATAVRVGKLLGANFILTGTTSLLNNRQTRYASRLIDVQTGKVVFAVTSDDNPTAKSAAGSSLSFLTTGGMPQASPSTVLTSSDWTWSTPVNLGPKYNSKYADCEPTLSADGMTLMFTSLRPGGRGDWDIWMSRRNNINSQWTKPVNVVRLYRRL